MKSNRILSTASFVSIIMFLLIGIAPIQADELDDLRAELADVQHRLALLESQQSDHQTEVNSRLDAIIADQPNSDLPSFLQWVQTIQLSGDFRYRHELIDAENNGIDQTGRTRQRIRLRINLDAQVNQQADIHVRIASGSSDPISANQTLDDAFSSKNIWLDRAYFDWHPDWLNSVHMLGGKMANPFRRVGGNQLIWDDSLNPEGLAANYNLDLTENDSLNIVGGAFWADEVSAGSDTMLWAVQADLRHNFAPDTYLLGGVSYYNYGNILHHNTLFDTTDSAGNSTVNINGANVYACDFDLVECYAQLTTPVFDIPFSVFGNIVTNPAAPSATDTAYLLGFTVNQAKQPGSWQFGYNFRELQADAVVGAFSEASFIGGGTNGRGHVFCFKYQIAQNMQTGLNYYLNELANNDAYNRLQAEFVFKF